jgi:hypothetical protein
MSQNTAEIVFVFFAIWAKMKEEYETGFRYSEPSVNFSFGEI